MYCKILYNGDIVRDLDADKSIINEEISSVTPKLKSADEVLYINPDCSTHILIDYIRSSIGIDPKYSFDLCNMNAELQNINEYGAHHYATEFLKPMESYICIIMHQDEEGMERMIPLISKKCSDLSVKLRKFHSRLSKRLSFEIVQKYRQSTTSESSKYIRTIPSSDSMNNPVTTVKRSSQKKMTINKLQ